MSSTNVAFARVYMHVHVNACDDVGTFKCLLFLALLDKPFEHLHNIYLWLWRLTTWSWLKLSIDKKKWHKKTNVYNDLWLHIIEKCSPPNSSLVWWTMHLQGSSEDWLRLAITVCNQFSRLLSFRDRADTVPYKPLVWQMAKKYTHHRQSNSS